MMKEGLANNEARWQRMEEIYHAALPLPAPKRHAFVAQHCAGDVALQEEVNTLLKSDDFIADFLQEPIFELGLAVLADEVLRDTEIMSQPTQPASDNLVSEKVGGRYEVIKKLGRGGFGDVYKATDTKVMSRPVILKVLRNDVLNDERVNRDWLVTKFQQEIEALAKIRDPGVVGIIDTDTLPDGRQYFVMEFVEGSNLRQFIQDARQQQHVTEQGLSFEDVTEIVRQVGRTLTAAHQAGVVHRDLKPENIMLCRNMSGDLQVKVIDFGIAKVRNSIVAPSTGAGLSRPGTPRYMAPEQLRGKKVDVTCDIYALGVIAYEMVTGYYPFPAKDAEQLKEMQEAGIKIKPRDLNPDLPAAAQEAILKALEFYPAERHKRARDFGDELAGALASAEELVRPVQPENVDLERKTLEKTIDGKGDDSDKNIAPPHPAPIRRPRLQRRWIYAASIVLLAAVISLVVWRAYKTRESQLPQQPATTQAISPERTLTYWFEVQRSENKEPLESTGNGVYEAGSKYWFYVQTTQDGALYLFAQGHEGDKPSELNTLFPTPVNGGGDSRIAANITKRVNEKETYYKFRNGDGVIYLWIIWADKPIPELDEIAKNSYNTQGTIIDSSQQKSLLDFIKQYSEPKPEVIEDDLHYRVTMKRQSKILVGMRRLEYHP
jgi:serine/threonine protein kinase